MDTVGNGERAAAAVFDRSLCQIPEEHFMASRGLQHHVELWVPDPPRAERSWGRLLTRLGTEPRRPHERRFPA